MRINTPRKAFELEGKTVDPSIMDRFVYQNDPEKFRVSGDGAFYTLQGEGTTMGKPATFLRLHHCNLTCNWCDSWYTWDERSREFWTESMLWTVQETRDRISAAWGCEDPAIQKRLVITGGEPLLQQQKISKLIEPMERWAIEIETNGTIMPVPELLSRCRFNCSPKLSHSDIPRSRRIRENVLAVLNEASTCFKFVVADEGDVEEVQNDLVEPLGLDRNKIVLMPEGVTGEEIARNALKVVEVVKRKGYRLLGRLHCDLWGAGRAK
ncbi:MAG: 7-carboxy-7-deazaguanine synthase QueE [Candidatus Peregrinibacteria bacterium]